MMIYRFLHFLHLINNFSATRASTFLLLFHPSSILSQPIWYHKNIKISSKPIYVEEFAKQNIIFLNDLFNTENEFKTWNEMKISYNLNNKSYFKWRKIINPIPKTWKKVLEES